MMRANERYVSANGGAQAPAAPLASGML